MYSIEILGNGYYLPKHKIENEELNTIFSIDSNWIYKRTGIQSRYYVEKEKIEDLAIGSVKNLLEHTNFSIKNVGIIVVATTSTSKLMPGISFAIQKYFSTGGASGGDFDKPPGAFSTSRRNFWCFAQHSTAFPQEPWPRRGSFFWPWRILQKRYKNTR